VVNDNGGGGNTGSGGPSAAADSTLHDLLLADLVPAFRREGEAALEQLHDRGRLGFEAINARSSAISR
jgi:hypothetical protein